MSEVVATAPDLACQLPEVWRLALRSGRKGMEGLHKEQVNYCLSKGIAALGWEADNDGTPDDALRQIEKAHDRAGRNTVRRFIKATDGSLVWTRHTDGTYRLGEITGGWRYDDSPIAHEFDCVQIREVNWADKSLDASEVPGAVIRAFSGRGSAFSRIPKDKARRYSHRLFDGLIGRGQPLTAATPEEVLRFLLDPWDVEDLVAIYLQVRRQFLVLPASRQTGTSGYEFVLIDSTSGEHAIVQVKTGDTPINIGKLATACGDNRRAFAFSTEGQYEGDDELVEKLTSQEMLSFMNDCPKLLPPKVRGWLGLA